MRAVHRPPGLVLAMLGCVVLAAPRTLADDDRAGSRQDARIEEILRNWEKQTRDATVLDVDFTRVGGIRDAFDPEVDQDAGRLVLRLPNEVDLALTRGLGKRKGRPDHRCVWTKNAFHEFHTDGRRHVVWPRAARDREQIPSYLALPFLFGMTLDDARRGYEFVCLLDRSRFGPFEIVLRIRPRPGHEDAWSGVETLIVVLDTRSYQPKKIVLRRAGGSGAEYRITRIWPDAPLTSGEFGCETPPGWLESRPVNQANEFLVRGLRAFVGEGRSRQQVQPAAAGTGH